jgi:hypothetical protein
MLPSHLITNPLLFAIGRFTNGVGVNGIVCELVLEAVADGLFIVMNRLIWEELWPCGRGDGLKLRLLWRLLLGFIMDWRF